MVAFADASVVAQTRNLTPAEVTAAVQSFVPPGKRDEYVMFASGGHSGQMLAIGLPSMRMLKVMAVFSPESWQGYGYGADWGKQILDEGSNGGPALTQVTAHRGAVRPAASTTAGGSTSTTAPMDRTSTSATELRQVPRFNIQTSHGVFATPNTDYVQYQQDLRVGRGLARWSNARAVPRRVGVAGGR
jgi:nitrous-oxide reductase